MNPCAVTIILLALLSAGAGPVAAAPSRTLAAEPGREMVTELLDPKGNRPNNPSPIGNGVLAANKSGMSADARSLSEVGNNGLSPSLGSAVREREFSPSHPDQFPPLEFDPAPLLDSTLFLVQNSNFLEDAAFFGAEEGKRKSQWIKKLKKLFGGHKNRTKKDLPEDGQFDFLQDVLSGSVNETLQEGGIVLQLELSPLTAFMSERPGQTAGTLPTEIFFNRFADIFGDGAPNAMLTLRGSSGTGTAISVPIALKDPEYEPLTGMVEFIATPLKSTSGITTPGRAVVIQSVAELSQFGMAFLFIDGGSFDPDGGFDPFDRGTCGDGAPTVCPITLGDSCTSPFPTADGTGCCTLGGDVSCGGGCVCR